MESVLDHTNPYDDSHNWTYPVKSCPDAIILLIGPNDFLEGPPVPPVTSHGFPPERRSVTGLPSAGDKPAEVPLQRAYMRLLEMQMTSYRKCARAQSKVGGFPMILVCGGSGNGLDPCRLENRIDDRFNSRHLLSPFQVHYVSMNHTTWHRINSSPEYLGCDKHYNEKGHQVLTSEVLPQVQSILGW